MNIKPIKVAGVPIPSRLMCDYFARCAPRAFSAAARTTLPRLPLSRPSLDRCSSRERALPKGCELRQGDRGDDERHADRREQGVALGPGDMRDQHPAEGRAERLAEVDRRGI